MLSNDDDDPHFSLITGKYMQGRKYAVKENSGIFIFCFFLPNVLFSNRV